MIVSFFFYLMLFFRYLIIILTDLFPVSQVWSGLKQLEEVKSKKLLPAGCRIPRRAATPESDTTGVSCPGSASLIE